jgi:hypothetical protein
MAKFVPSLSIDLGASTYPVFTVHVGVDAIFFAQGSTPDARDETPVFKSARRRGPRYENQSRRGGRTETISLHTSHTETADRQQPVEDVACAGMSYDGQGEWTLKGNKPGY